MSAEFFNDNLSSPDDLIQLAGDPGTFEVVPEPSSVLLLVFGATAFVFRRRVLLTYHGLYADDKEMMRFLTHSLDRRYRVVWDRTA